MLALWNGTVHRLLVEDAGSVPVGDDVVVDRVAAGSCSTTGYEGVAVEAPRDQNLVGKWKVLPGCQTPVE